MYDIKKVIIRDFRSFSSEHTFTFPVEPGLYGIDGKNLTMRGDEGNGAGKSSLLEAIHWCDYGHTTRGLKAGDVVNWGAKSCAVTVHHTIGTKKLVVTRTQSPNSLTLNGDPIDQEALEKHLRIGPDAFAYSVLTAQFGEAFFEKSPGDKLAIFSEIMELDYWLDKSKEASVLAADIETEKAKLEQKLAKDQGRLETTVSDIEDLKAKLATFDREKKLILKKLRANEELNITSKRCFEGEVAAATDAVTGLKAKLEATSKVAEQYAGQAKKLESDARTLYVAKTTIETQLKATQRAADGLTGLKGTCPTCLQNVDVAHLKTEKQRILKEAGRFQVQLEQAVADVSRATNQIDRVETAMIEHTKTLNGIRKSLEEFSERKSSIERKLSEAAHKGHSLASNIENEENKANPYIAMLNAKKYELVSLKGFIEDTEKSIEGLNSDHAGVSFWIGGFKRVRLYLIEEAIKQLELEINNNLGSLGLLNWNVTLDVERENKSGGVTKGFTVLVQPPGSDKPVKLESYSGGETQRLLLAGNLGLANLIMERAGLYNTIEFFDEPSQHLSNEGLLDLTETLYQRAIDSKKRVFIIEHHLLDYPYTGTYTVTKDKNGSKITC